MYISMQLGYIRRKTAYRYALRMLFTHGISDPNSGSVAVITKQGTKLLNSYHRIKVLVDSGRMYLFAIGFYCKVNVPDRATRFIFQKSI